MDSILRRLSLLSILSIALVACGGAPVAQPPTSVPTSAPTAAPTVMPTSPALTTSAAPNNGALSITDDLGRSLTLAATPQRIVSLAPSVTEILFAVGAGPQVVGDTTFCNFPPEAKGLPKIGGYSAKSISIEAVVGLKPDLVIAGTASQKPVVESLGQLKIPVLVLAPGSFEGVYNSIQQIGTLTGHAAQADQVVTQMRGRVEAVQAKVGSIPSAERPTVFWEVFDDPLITSGPNTFIGQMIAMAGATNIFAEAKEDYPKISAETVLERNPLVIFGPASQRTKLTVAAISQRPGWSDIRAVRDGRIYLLDDDIITRPGPRLADALEAVAKALFPAQLAAASAANGFPVTVENCGVSQTYSAPPQRAVTMNQAATEVMLALGLQDRMVGTAYLDDKIWPDFADTYAKISVLAKEYPSREALLGVQPDFVYAAYASAFDDTAAGARGDLAKLGANSYISPAGCPKDVRPKTITLDTAYGEIREIGRIFGVAKRAEQLIATYQADLQATQAKISAATKPLRVFWYDSEDPPSVGACCGIPNELMRLVGAENIFNDAQGSWATVNWEDVVARNPDMIVLVDVSWSTAADKRKLLIDTKAYASIDAVKNSRFVTIDFSYTTPGIRNVPGVRKLAEALYPEAFK
jgi:iron complex transport system substrate-binding protein